MPQRNSLWSMESDSESTKQGRAHLSFPRKPPSRKSSNRLKINCHRLPTISLKQILTCRDPAQEGEEDEDEEEEADEDKPCDQSDNDAIIIYYGLIYIMRQRRRC